MNPKFSLFLFWLILGFSPIVGGLSVNLISPVFLVLLASVAGFCYFLFPVIKNGQTSAIFDKFWSIFDRPTILLTYAQFIDIFIEQPIAQEHYGTMFYAVFYINNNRRDDTQE